MGVARARTATRARGMREVEALAVVFQIFVLCGYVELTEHAKIVEEMQTKWNSIRFYLVPSTIASFH